ncbi:hypothetical protein AO386_22425 [Pseudomonas syringae ICMP 11292]|nr:hypothetical protein AO386_22425 [Pseudomonas syringae ICMP 11292]
MIQATRYACIAEGASTPAARVAEDRMAEEARTTKAQLSPPGYMAGKQVYLSEYTAGGTLA